jgi:GT2 family glycosyltransferase
LNALAKQTVLPDEIIVVDQNQPELAALTSALAANPKAKHLRFKTKGVTLNYNRALAAARGEIVLFLDDDVVPDERLIEEHLACYARDPAVGGVMGRVEQPSGDLPPERIRRVGSFAPWSGKVVANFNAKERREIDVVQGLNMSFRREVLLKEDGFDLGFVGNAYYFEADVGLRVRGAGFKILFEPRANLRHLMAPAGGTRVKDKAMHTYYFVRNGVRLVRRHSPWLARPLITLRMVAYLAAKAGYNLDARILTLGLQGIWQGWRDSVELVGLSSDLQKNQP